MTYKSIPTEKMTPRQLWAVGALAQKFYAAGTLGAISYERDKVAAEFLAESGYTEDEIDPIVEHMNSCACTIKNTCPGQRRVIEANIIQSIKEGRHRPPAP